MILSRCETLLFDTKDHHIELMGRVSTERGLKSSIKTTCGAWVLSFSSLPILVARYTFLAASIPLMNLGADKTLYNVSIKERGSV